MEPSLELQKAIRLRLVATSAVTSLVPATAIIDRNGTPEIFPCILIGEGQTVPGGLISRKHHEVFADLHIWTREPGVVTSKQIAGAVRDALGDALWNIAGLQVADLYVASSRFMRDPDGLHAHAVIGLSAQLVEVA